MHPEPTAAHSREEEPRKVPSPAELAARLQLAFFRRRIANAPRCFRVWTSQSDGYGGDR